MRENGEREEERKREKGEGESCALIEVYKTCHLRHCTVRDSRPTVVQKTGEK